MIVGCLIGLIFGITLEKSKVSEPAVIIGQLRFKRFIMLKVFLTAMITSVVVLNSMNYLGLFDIKLKDLNLVTNILGGGLLGTGIALSGACPGTMFAQMGSGYKDVFFTFGGGLVAAYLYNFFGPNVVSQFSSYSLGKTSLATLFKTTPTVIIGLIVIVNIIFLTIVEKIYPWKEELKS